MDHAYIDEHSVAERYLQHDLRPEERAAFEAHLVDCQECMDRLLLAGMFQVRSEIPVRAGFPIRLLVIFFAAAVLVAGAFVRVLLWLLHAIKLR